MKLTSSKAISIVDKGTTVDGTITGVGQLVVKGSVQGSLTGEDVVVAKEGSVTASTTVNRLTIGGSFDGEVEAVEDTIVLATGRCAGTVVCKNLVVEAGGQLDAMVVSKDLPVPESSTDSGNDEPAAG